jgi:hypothetical protein
MNSLAKGQVYSYRIDALKSQEITDEIRKHIESKMNVKFIGKHEIAPVTKKPHYQLCLIFDKDVEINHQHFRNIKKRKWVSKTKQPLSFKVARKPDKLMSYVTKGDGDLITNLTDTEIEKIEPWKTELEMKENKYLSILNYLKKRLKDINNDDDYVSVYEPYKYQKIEVENQKIEYEFGDRLDPTQKQDIMIEVTKEYYNRYNIIMTKKTQLKLMLATKIMSWKEYLQMNWDFYKIFSV